jgi:RNA polymerase sigma-70 factor (ECF subfamily)
MLWFGRQKSDLATLTDEEIMLRSRQDPEAFAVITERYQKKVYNVLLRSVQDPTTAEDLFQETFLKAFEARHRYQVRGSFASWLFTIARNLLTDRSRLQGRGKVISLDARDRSGAVAPESLGDTHADPAPAPDALVATRERHAWVREAVARLPEGQREILLLSRYHGMSYQQIAEIVGCSAEAVKQKVYRAMVTLRSWHDSEFEGEEVTLREDL